MILLKTRLYCFVLLVAGSCIYFPAVAQQVTGVWEGKINNTRVEVKIIQNGDSLAGTSYYYASSGAYRRYTIKGFFDAQTNEVVWWDNQLVKSQAGSPGKSPLLSVADFNCPGGEEMHLDGKAAPKNERGIEGNVSLIKIPHAKFPDEWDYIIDNYTIGSNNPDIIDSIGLIASTPITRPEIIFEKKAIPEPQVYTLPRPDVVVVPTIQAPLPAITIEEKFTTRKKIFTTEIPVEGDSIELRFYDNAQIDGDSISLFLNDVLIFSHVRLTDKPYTIKLSVNELKESNELTMVAENLGAIPPNTSYMVAVVGENRYDAYLASTENSSAMIRLKKK